MTGWSLAPSGSSSTVVDPRSVDHPAPTLTAKFNAEWAGRRRRAMAKQGRDPQAVRITTAEAAVLQSYPADFKFEGAKGKVGLQIGNAVPPLLAQRVLESLWADAA